MISPLALKVVGDKSSGCRWSHSCLPRARVPVEMKLVYRTPQLIHRGRDTDRSGLVFTTFQDLDHALIIFGCTEFVLQSALASGIKDTLGSVAVYKC